MALIERPDEPPTPGAPRRVWARVARFLVTAVVLGVLVGTAFLGSWPPLRIVMSPSMEPAIETGDVAVIRAVSGPPEVGDVVVVPVPEEIQDRYRYPGEVLHRVIEITPDGLVRTQGDNLAEPDPFGVPVSALQGTTVMVIPGLGKAFAFISSPFGLAWLVVGVVVFALVPFIGSQRDVVYAVEEYGFHLRSHTQILKSMSEASQQLSATAVELRETVVAAPRARPGPVRSALPVVEPAGVAPVPEPPLPPVEPPQLYDDEMNPAVEPVGNRRPGQAELPLWWPDGAAR